MNAILLAQTEQQPESTPSAENAGGGNPLGPLVILLPMMVLLYFIMIRPMKKQEKDRQSLLSSLKKNDRVVTSGGLIGVISSIRDKEDEITLKVDENSNLRLRVTKGSIVRVLSEPEPAKEGAESKA